jgi:hypothetical protein
MPCRQYAAAISGELLQIQEERQPQEAVAQPGLQLEFDLVAASLEPAAPQGEAAPQQEAAQHPASKSREGLDLITHRE